MKRIKKLFIIGYALFSILIIQNCKENKISFEELLTKEGVYWDLHHPEIKTVTYSYRFDKSQKVTYFFMIGMKRTELFSTMMMYYSQKIGNLKMIH